VRSIAAGHIFDNGNKRTAQAVVAVLKNRNGITTGVSAAQMRRVIDQVATGALTEVADIARRLFRRP
jgi:prophage maintenance system killer protein